MNTALQLIIGLGLLNVWVLRSARGTSYRGGTAQTLRAEFLAYRLPDVAFFIVGTLKVVAGVILLAGLWWPMPVQATAIVVAMLMVGAIGMHTTIKDPIGRSVPAIVMLALCALLAART